METFPLQGVLRRNRLTVLRGQGHFAMNEAPELFVREVLAFIDARLTARRDSRPPAGPRALGAHPAWVQRARTPLPVGVIDGRVLGAL
ncbi:hypothetical protein [Stigmatella aurantiaca]|uniref:Uncharacterized protein n=1 Tax=Stigmatella aurantiaca (strain DW4/3-1) TaxID=378806 RepID=E3FH86_STIAD|nr:hypothetical protein [Stigmatella aurantiaca]ADO75302.1 uncharacterized protein STAUR_7547 [Stigmatella aurantiaca DW4/3-1]